MDSPSKARKAVDLLSENGADQHEGNSIKNIHIRNINQYTNII